MNEQGWLCQRGCTIKTFNLNTWASPFLKLHLWDSISPSQLLMTYDTHEAFQSQLWTMWNWWTEAIGEYLYLYWSSTSLKKCLAVTFSSISWSCQASCVQGTMIKGAVRLQSYIFLWSIRKMSLSYIGMSLVAWLWWLWFWWMWGNVAMLALMMGSNCDGLLSNSSVHSPACTGCCLRHLPDHTLPAFGTIQLQEMAWQPGTDVCQQYRSSKVGSPY